MKPKSNSKKLGLIVFVLADIILLGLCLLQIFHPIFHVTDYGVFNAQGTIAQAQSRVIITAVLIMLVIVLPVLGAGFYIAFKYRAGREQTYDPEWGQRHQHLQFLMWVFPALIIAFLSVLNFRSAHDLDPSKAIASPNAPITIQVVALPWKWLFLYPQQN